MLLKEYRNRFISLGATDKIFEILDALAFSLLGVVLLFTFFFTLVRVDGDSMQTTLYDGDRLVISDFCYTPKPSDIVIISRNYDNSEIGGADKLYDNPIVKRVIAVAGQKIDIKDGKVYIDDEVLEEDYINAVTYALEFDGPKIVPEGHIFVLGDNRGNSLDSRFNSIGMVDVRYVIGKVLFRIAPFGEIKFF